MFLTKLMKTVVENVKAKREQSELVQRIDNLKWEHELKPATTKLAEELEIPYEDALAYVKSIDVEKGNGTFKDKLANLTEGLRAASESFNTAMGVDELPQEEPVKQNKSRGTQRKTRTNVQEEDSIWEPDIYIPEIYIPKL